jgi:cysteine desulfurase family protein
VKKLIYFDNAATTFPKPEEVYLKVDHILRNVGANPGRSGHRMALEANRIILDARDSIARLFNIEDSSRIVFTSNTTEALNIGIKGFLRPGDHAITSSMEHNSVVRPLKAMERAGVECSKLRCSSEGIFNPEDVRAAIRPRTRLIAITHASNVTGSITPIREIGAIAREKGIVFLLDAAQTAGMLPIDVERDNIDMLACPGHKGLFGLQGTGFLYISPSVELEPIKDGGTGGNSEMDTMPDTLPERFEAGTMNTPGIAGLGEGVEFVLREGIDKIRSHEANLTDRLMKGLAEIKGVTVYGPGDANRQMAVVSFNITGKDPSDVGFVLDSSFGIMARVGLHCAPDAHRTIGTFPQGTVRLSPGYFNTMEEVDFVVGAVRKICSI